MYSSSRLYLTARRSVRLIELCYLLKNSSWVWNMWEIWIKVWNSWWWAWSIRHDIFCGWRSMNTDTHLLFSLTPLLYIKPAQIYINLLSYRWCYHWQLCHNGTSPHIALETIPSHAPPLKERKKKRKKNRTLLTRLLNFNTLPQEISTHLLFAPRSKLCLHTSTIWR